MRKNRFKIGDKVYWNDPDPIEGNNYNAIVRDAFYDHYWIAYNNARSEADVPGRELRPIEEEVEKIL